MGKPVLNRLCLIALLLTASVGAEEKEEKRVSYERVEGQEVSSKEAVAGVAAALLLGGGAVAKFLKSRSDGRERRLAAQEAAESDSDEIAAETE